MHKPKKEPEKTQCGIKGLVIAGLVAAFVGVAMIVRPVSYVSTGATGAWGNTPTMSSFTGGDAAFIGLLILFMGGFILMIAYNIKKS